MYVGLDIFKNEIVSIGMDKEGSLLHREKYELYTEEIDRLVDTVGKDSIFVLEPSTYGVFVYDYLSSKNIKVIAANPGKIQEIRESDKKTDWEMQRYLQIVYGQIICRPVIFQIKKQENNEILYVIERA